MTQWETIFRQIAVDIETGFDRLKQRLDRHINLDSNLIQPYMGYGNGRMLRLRGRVMEDQGITQVDDRDTIWTNLLNTYRRFATKEIPFAAVRIQFGNDEAIVKADEEGYFTAELEIEDIQVTQEILHQVKLQLVDFPAHPEVTGTIIITGRNAEFGVISDLDDTVIQSDVSNLFKLAKNTFLQNAHARLPFPGVAAFYRALKRGYNNVQNPIFYVSSSPWNLYDLLTDFMSLKDIPLGPLFLQDIGLSADQWLTKDHSQHKGAAIEELLQAHPDLPFILIGDSTQHDAEIYAEIASRYSDQIKTIYIRDVNTSNEKREILAKLTDELDSNGTPIRLVKDTEEAAAHAVSMQFIHPETMQEIQAEKHQDKESPNMLELLVEEADITE